MTSPHNSATRLSAPALLSFLVLGISLALLMGNRLDVPWAGGEGAGPHHEATLVKSLFTNADPALPQTLQHGESITTDATTFAAYALNNCTVYLAENTSLTLQDGRENQTTFTILTGRVVAEGECALVTRETSVRVNGTATLVHFSWLDELIVKTVAGETQVTQGEETVLIPADGDAERFFTLPSVSRHESSAFSFTEPTAVEAFYTWSFKK